MFVQLKLSAVLLVLGLLSCQTLVTSAGSGSICKKPKANVSSFSTQDATILTELAHIGEFTLECSNADAKAIVLYGQFPCGKVVPVAQVGDNRYQVNTIRLIKR